MTRKHWISISQKCNNKCIFCLDSENQVNGKFKEKQEVIQDMAVGIKKKATRIILSGGEASIHPKFIEFISIAKKMGYQEVQTITNGRMFAYLPFLEKAVKAGLSEITFSLHTHKPLLFDKLTGINGSYKQAIAGLANANKFKALIKNIDIVINKYNYDHIYNIIDFFSSKFGIYEYDLLQIIPMGRARVNKKELFFDFDLAMKYLRKVFELAKNDKRFVIWTNRFPAKYLEGYEFLIQDPNKLLDDIKGAQEMFNNYFNKDQLFGCYKKEVCAVCYLKDFCNYVIWLKKNTDNSIENKILNRMNPAKCLPDSNNLKKININFIKDGKINVIKFAKFYIDNLYKIKSTRCVNCKVDCSCDGIKINHIKDEGFKIIKPINYD